MRHHRLALTATIPLFAVLTACVSGSPAVDVVPQDEAPVTAAPALGAVTERASAAPADGAPAAPGDAAPGSTIATHLEAQPAVIQIQAMGGQRDPEFGNYVSGGAGSGFLISSDGLAVTNNHVVTGAATLEVFIGGDTSTSYTARVVGASECNDLALIDISEDAPLPYLNWSSTDVSVGQEIYVAGFPLGDPEYTLSRGIVAKAKADGEGMPWASIDHTMEHDANAHPGNSGGPLLSPAGEVVGIHYAGFLPEDMVRLGYAIDHTLAEAVVNHLKDGDFESLGINGTPVYDEGLAISGIWVSGVKPGSPAAKAKVLPGDIITSLNGLPMAMDGDMSDYCDVLRTAGDDAPMSIEVLRWDTSEVLRGEVNNPNAADAAITPVMSFAEEVGDEVAAAPEAAAEQTYETVVDDSGSITVDLPTHWADRKTAAHPDSGMPYIAGSADIESFENNWAEPGLVFTLSDPTDDLVTLLSDLGLNEFCVDDGVSDYSDGIYTGFYQVFSDCGGTGSTVVVLAATPADNAYTAVMLTQIMTEADLDALDRAFSTFNYIND